MESTYGGIVLKLLSQLRQGEKKHWPYLIFNHFSCRFCRTVRTHFVSRNASRIPAIIRAQRSDGIVTTFQVNNDQWSDIVDANHTIQQVAAKYPKIQKTMLGDDLKPEMEAVKYF